MDILIRGMEMPKDGHWGTVSIPFYIHGDGSVSDSKGHIIGTAVYIPPHGDLVDRSALHFADVDLCGNDYLFMDEIRKEIDAVLTIIPASNV